MSQIAVSNARGGGKLLRMLIFLCVVIALFVLGGVYHAQVGERFTATIEWIDSLGPLGPILFGAIYILACVLLVPGLVLTLGAGFAFGVFWGTVTVSIASTLGAGAAFLVGRTVARGWIEQKIAGNPKFAAIDKAAGREAFKIVLLTRLSPIFPFNLLNYAYGLTRAPFRSYLLASWIGMLPGTLMYVYYGSATREAANLAAGREKGTLDYVVFAVGLVLVVVVAVFVTRMARKALRQAMEPDGAGTP